jgi:2-C-methyl-D-erythritol 4-phosphate cytidylyltransferase/2-C-methyl-D-erythritol 2,4-cyclodiphosphate synthase
MRTVAVVLAGGTGTRFGSDKTVLGLRGKPLWMHSYDVFRSHPGIDGVCLIAGAHNLAELRVKATEAIFVEQGGETRTGSSRRAVELASCERILIHDAARPLIPESVIDRVLESLDSGHVAVAPAVPVSDTIRRVLNGKTETPDRRELFAMQTPQAAVHAVLKKAYSECTGEFTDEMALLESIGIQPTLVAGEPRNFKVTTTDDLMRAAAYLGGPESRTGLGYDIHAVSTDPDRPMYLGGVRFDGPGLEGHSDADVVLHAVTDALLGAACLGDIGQHFPNTDPKWKNAASVHFLQHAAALLAEQGWQVMHVDVSVVAEFPKVMPRAVEVRTAIANAIGIESGRVSLKATTNEKLGAIGRSEGVAAFAVATIRQTS